MARYFLAYVYLKAKWILLELRFSELFLSAWAD